MQRKMLPEPGHLNLKLTDACNMQCKMCGQLYSEYRKKQSNLEWEKIKQIILDTPSVNSAYLFGGEPFIYKDIETLMKFFSEHDIAMDMTTNGAFLHKYVDTIFDYNINSITISIDTINREKYKEIRGVDCLDLVVKNVKELLEKKKLKTLSRRPYININCVIIKDNLDELEDIYEYCYREFPDLTAINFETQVVMSKTLGTDYEALMKDRFQSKSESWKWFYDKTGVFTEEEKELIFEKISWLKQKDKATFLAPVERIRFEHAFSEDYMYGDRLCFKPYTSLSILPNGDVTFCVDFPDYILGNIYESSINEIWYSERAKNYQRYLLDNNIPICARCPHAY